MELWRKVWRLGLAPQLNTPVLQALANGLMQDDDALVQNATTLPPDFPAGAGAAVCGACALAYGAWKGLGLETVREVSEFFTNICLEADAALGEPAGCRHFLDWFDHTRRERMRAQLLDEVLITLSQRHSLAA